MTTEHQETPFRVVIAGGGIAAAEAALALHELAGERIALTLLAPAPDLVYRPMAVREPFAGEPARRYPVDEIARAAGAELRRDAFKWLEPSSRVIESTGGERIHYDALLIALGAVPHARLAHATTLDDGRIDVQLHGLIQDVEGGYARRIAFVIPSQIGWPLPMYELALMTIRRAGDMGQDTSVTVITPERAPLAIFGREASDAVSALLEQEGIATLCGVEATTPRAGEIALRPGGEPLRFDRIVSLPELSGPSTPGVPKDDDAGFIPVDGNGRVLGMREVFAAGDATDFPIKHGGIAAQQANAAAHAIAALAGADVAPEPFDGWIEGILLGGARPLALKARLSGGHATHSRAGDTDADPAHAKIAAPRLKRYVEQRPPAR